mgnify:CR=1 FL=1
MSRPLPVPRAVEAAGQPLVALPIDVDLDGARRLSLVVEATGAGDPGFPVRFESPVIDR